MESWAGPGTFRPVDTAVGTIGAPTIDTVGPGARRYASFAWATLAANLGVILWGAFVRATGSGAGCGDHWPLCNGVVVPRAPSVETLIELGHRLTSGIALLLVVALVVGAWRRFPRGHVVRRAAAASGVLIVAEALIGAGLVLLELVAGDVSTARAWWMAGHLVNTFLLVAALTLTAWWATSGERPRLRGAGAILVTLVASLAGMLVLGVSGAITALGDTLFPVTTFAEGKALTFSESAHLFVRLRVWHPVLAVIVGVLLAVAAVHATRHRGAPAVRRAALAVVGLVVVQLGVGLVNMWLLAPVPLQLVHLLLADLVWIALVVLSASALAAA